MKFLLLSLLALNAFAEEACREVNLADQLLQALPEKQCPTDSETVTKLVNEEYKKFYGSRPLKKKRISGYVLSGPDTELDVLDDMLGEKPPKNWAQVASACQTSQCALEKLFGSKEAAMQVMNVKAKTGYTLSIDQDINGGLKEQYWSANEIREFDAAASKLPPEIRNLTNLKNIYRMADGLRLKSDSESVAAYAQPGTMFFAGKIVSYDAGMRGTTTGKNPYQGTSWPQEAMVHEICHHHDFQAFYKGATKMSSEQKNSSWGALSGWKEVTNAKGQTEWQKKADAKFVSWYAETAPAEDYAESCMNYVLHPQTLKDKAPEKYAWMKKNLFNNKEFTDKIWAGPQSWPELKNLLADEASCTQKLIECTNGLKLNTWKTAEAQIQESKCFAEFKAQKLKDINLSLMDRPEYCDKGGAGTVNAQGANICAKSLKGLSSFVQPALSYNFGSAVKECEAKNDFTANCVLAATPLLKSAPADIAPTVRKFLEGQVPDRMNAVASKFNDVKSSVWLKACLDTVKEVDIYQISDTKEPIYSYVSKATGKSDFIGKYIYRDYDREDGNKECAVAAVKSLEAEGVKTPEGGHPVNVMKEKFVGELRSFESEVIGQYKGAIKGCILKSCKKERTLKLLKDWEAKSPQREGFATEEYAEELVKKIN